MVNNNLVGGWPTHLKMMEFVSWDDELPNIWKNVPNHQPVAVSPTNSEPIQQVYLQFHGSSMDETCGFDFRDKNHIGTLEKN